MTYNGYPQPVQPMIVQAARPTSGLAVASIVLGILGLVSSCCSFGIFSLFAIILGHIALPETKDGRKGGPIPSWMSGYDLVLQTCTGASGMGFSLAQRIR